MSSEPSSRVNMIEKKINQKRHSNKKKKFVNIFKEYSSNQWAPIYLIEGIDFFVLSDF